MVSLNDLIDQIWPKAQALLPVENVPIDQAFNRVLAQDMHSPLDVPPQDNSAMDGYAVRVQDLSANPTQGFDVSQRVPAGCVPSALQPGTVARIFTGAFVPEGADAVVMQEDTEALGDGRVRFLNLPSSGKNIRRKGEDIQAGHVVLPIGKRLGAAQLGLLASIGCAQVPVYRSLKVGMLFTGSELQLPGQAPALGKIYNSNQFLWLGLLQKLGVEIVNAGIVPDTLDATRAALRSLAHCDVVLSSGGVSVGEEDHVKNAVLEEGELHAWKVAMKPGKPVVFGRLRSADSEGTWFFGLPGNPVSSFVSFMLIVKPFLQKLAGESADAVDWRAHLRPVAAGFAWPRADARQEFIRVRAGTDGRLEKFPNQSSGVLTSIDFATGLAVLAPHQTVVAGDAVQYLDFSSVWAT